MGLIVNVSISKWKPADTGSCSGAPGAGGTAGNVATPSNTEPSFGRVALTAAVRLSNDTRMPSGCLLGKRSLR